MHPDRRSLVLSRRRRLDRGPALGFAPDTLLRLPAGGRVLHCAVPGYLDRYPARRRTSIYSSQEQVVRVNSFAETQRNDESVLYQDGLILTPGEWRVLLQVEDGLSGRKGRAEAQVKVPALGDGSVSVPRLVYQARGRGDRSSAVAVIVNPRGSIAYGSDSLTLYVEGYAMSGPTAVRLTMIDANGEVVGRDSIRFEGNRDVSWRHRVPIIPFAVVGAEEIYPMIGRSSVLGKLLGAPYVPITPFFPTLGLLGTVPLPTKWTIAFGNRIYLYRESRFRGPGSVDFLAMSERLRRTVQLLLRGLLARRSSIFLG